MTAKQVKNRGRSKGPAVAKGKLGSPAEANPKTRKPSVASVPRHVPTQRSRVSKKPKQKPQNEQLRWPDMPFKPYVENKLLETYGLKPRRGRWYTTEPFTKESRAAVTALVDYDLPDSLLKKIILNTIQHVDGPPAEIHCDVPKATARGEHESISHMIMCRSEIEQNIHALLHFNYSTSSILNELKSLPMIKNLRLESLDRYIKQFWNIRPSSGWTWRNQKSFKAFIERDPHLRSAFAYLLHWLWSDKPLAEVAEYFGKGFEPDTREAFQTSLVDKALLLQKIAMNTGDLNAANLGSQVTARIIRNTKDMGMTIPVTPPKLEEILPEKVDLNNTRSITKNAHRKEESS